MSATLYVWLALFGVWPLAHPDHWPLLADPLTFTDLALHVVGAVLLCRHLARPSKESDRG